MDENCSRNGSPKGLKAAPKASELASSHRLLACSSQPFILRLLILTCTSTAFFYSPPSPPPDPQPALAPAARRSPRSSPAASALPPVVVDRLFSVAATLAEAKPGDVDAPFGVIALAAVVVTGASLVIAQGLQGGGDAAQKIFDRDSKTGRRR